MQLTQALHKARREHPERTATICGARRRTYAELVQRVARAADFLADLGVEAGDRVAVLSPNTDRFVEACSAGWWAGAVPMPLNCRWTPDEIAYALDDSGTKILLIDDMFIDMLPALRERAKTLQAVVHLGDGAAPEGTLSYEQLLAGAAERPDVRSRGEDAAVLFYTGGTTGRAKGVLLSHAGLYVTTLASLAVAHRAPGAVCLHALPFFHVGGMAVLLQGLAGQCTQIMLPTFEPTALFALIERERVTELALVPTMIKRVVDHPEARQCDLSSLERLYYGASPIDGTLLDQTIALLPKVAFTQFYGMTETSGIAVALPDWCHTAESRILGRHLTAGLALHSVEVCVADAQGEELPPGELGELWLRGPGVMLGYWNLHEQTAQVLRDGWMRTGDGGYVDDEGLIHIVDRLKDMIVTGGENVYSTEVENAILSLPGVAQCAVIGIPDPDWGERVHAAVVLQPGAKLVATAVTDHCKKLIAGYKCPRSVEFLPGLPISGAGKVLKYKLRDAFWQGHARRIA